MSRFSRRFEIRIAATLVLAALCCAASAEGPTRLTLDRNVHFLDPDGNDVLAEAGTYEVSVTGGGSLLRLYPAGGGPPLTLATKTTSHKEVSAPLRLAVQLADGDEVHVALLLPEQKALDARGSHAGSPPGPSGGTDLSQRYARAALERRSAVATNDVQAWTWDEFSIATSLGTETFQSWIGERTWTAHRIGPGASVSVSGLPVSAVQSIDAVRLVVYSGLFSNPPVDVRDEFGFPVPISLRLDPHSVSEDRRSFRAELDRSFTGQPAGAAYLEVDYHRAGEARTVALGAISRSEPRTPTWLRYRWPALYFVPRYVVYLGEVEIPIDADNYFSSLNSSVIPLRVGTVYPRYFRVRSVKLQPSPEFPGRSFLRIPCATPNNPSQGYHVAISPVDSGTLTMQYHIIGPRGVAPPGAQNFDSFRELHSFEGELSGGAPVVPASPSYWDAFPALYASGVAGRCEVRGSGDW